ncbi:hypothetical protein CR51_15455 [Caballeronia megalochromosomata]|nr:hypothetical protein CR51_15455 [Caballeronia megalochromosomata]
MIASVLTFEIAPLSNPVTIRPFMFRVAKALIVVPVTPGTVTMVNLSEPAVPILIVFSSVAIA